MGLTTNQFFEQVAFSILAKSFLRQFHCQAYTWEHLGDILDEIIINGDQRSLESLKGVGMKYPEGKCFEVPHSNIDLESTGGIDFKMTFKRSNLSKSSLSIFVTDPFRSSWRRDLFTFR